MAFDNPIVAGEDGALVRASIQSETYTPGIDGWSINRDGTAEFNDVTIREGAIVGGSITVGDPGNPQVVIDSSSSIGRINFPTNAASEAIPARITSQAAFEGDPDEQLWLNVTGARSTADTDQADITLKSVALDSSSGAEINIVAPGLGAVSSARVDLANGVVAITGDVSVSNDVTLEQEIYVGNSNADSNYPIRVAHGKVETGSTVTTINNATDTNITDAGTSGFVLENGVAYQAEIQVQTRSSVGSSAAGTQIINWKLWEGSVGATQLGPTVDKATDSVSNSYSTQGFSFLFEYGGTTGSKTLALSAIQITGTDTLQVRVNTRYYLLLKRIGDPANIAEL